MDSVSLNVTKVYGITANSPAAISCADEKVVACCGSGAVSIDPSSGTAQPPLYASAPKPNSTNKPAWDASDDSISESPSRSPRSPSRVQPKANTASAVAVSRQGYVAVGETGYMPRVVLYAEDSSPLATVREHQFGVNHLSFCPQGNLLASLGNPNDGYIYIWKIDKKKHQLTQFAANKCISDVRHMFWLSDIQLVTVGVRHVKLWTLPETSDGAGNTSGVLNGRSVVLKEAADATFESGCSTNGGRDWIVGASNGGIYRLFPDVQVIAKVNGAVKSIIQRNSEQGSILVGTTHEIVEYDARWQAIRSYPVHCIGLVSTADGTVLSLDAAGCFRCLDSLHSDEPKREPDNFTNKPIPQRVQLRQKGEHTLWWSTSLTGILDRPELPPQDRAAIPGRDDSQIEITSATLDSNSEIVSGTSDGYILYDGELTKAHNGAVMGCDMVGSNRLVTCGRDRHIQIFSRHAKDKWLPEQTLATSHAALKVVVLNESVVACSTAGRTVHIFRSVSDNGPFGQFKTITTKGIPVDITGYNNHLVVSTTDKQILVFDTYKGNQSHVFRPSDANGEPLCLSHIVVFDHRGSTLLAGAASDKSVALYSFPSGVLLKTEWGHAEPITGLVWNSDSESLISAADSIIARDISVREYTPDASRTSQSPTRSPARLARSPSRCRSVSASGSPPNSPSDTSLGSASRSSSPSRTKLYPQAIPRTPPGSPPHNAHSTRLASGVSLSHHASESRQLPTSPTPRASRITRSMITSSPIRPFHLGPAVATGANLETALKAFNSNPGEFNAEKLKPLLIDAINKVDGLALVQVFGDKIVDLVRAGLETTGNSAAHDHQASPPE